MSVLLHPSYRRAIPNHWPSRCTVQQKVASKSASNQDVFGTPTDVPGMVNLQCRLGPTVYSDVGPSEVRDKSVIADFSPLHLTINAYLPDLLVRDMQIVIDGQVWQIRGVEFDSEKFLTRVRVEQVTL